jgi:serine/threonine-protein kinase
MDVSRNGTLVAAPADAARGALRLSWVNREGIGEALDMANQSVNSVRLSPDEGRFALDSGTSIAIVDLSRRSITRLTLSQRSSRPAWSHDGRRLYFGLEKDRHFQVFSRAADNSGATVPEFPSVVQEVPLRVSRDGSVLLSASLDEDGMTRLLTRPISGADGRNPGTVLTSPYVDFGADLSPDARWVAYTSDESGGYEVYVNPASGADRRWRVSIEGGVRPIWSRDGKEIFYLCGSRFMSAPVVVEGDELVVGTPKILFENHRISTFDASRDGKRFLVAEDPNPGAQTRLDVAVNWGAEVKRKVREAKAP